MDRANELGLVMRIVVTFREHGKQARLNEEVLNSSNAGALGKLLGSRYKDYAVVWLLGTDGTPEGGGEVWRAPAPQAIPPPLVPQ